MPYGAMSICKIYKFNPNILLFLSNKLLTNAFEQDIIYSTPLDTLIEIYIFLLKLHDSL